jgi:hypothetical protein
VYTPMFALVGVIVVVVDMLLFSAQQGASQSIEGIEVG